MMRIIFRMFKSWKALFLLLSIAVVTLIINVVSISMPNDVRKQIWNEINSVQRKSLEGELNIPTFPSQSNNSLHESSGNTEVSHVAFLKVHKAASSTAQNIFLRFGWRRNLTFVLAPAKNPNGYPNVISLSDSLTEKNIVPPPTGRHYDILCNHVLYRHDSFSRFMPKDSVYIGIVREPFELYKSILNYFRPRYIYKKINSAIPGSDFLRDPSKYEPKGNAIRSWTKGRMAVEYGFPQSLFDQYDPVMSAAYIKELGKTFKLVIISELMEESVVLMRRLLHWTTRDILYVDQNISRKKNESVLTKPFDRDFYKQHAPLDYDLYNYFYKRLKEQIRDEGADFDDELLAFRAIRKRLQDFCTIRPQTPLVVEATGWGPGFTVTKEDCSYMTMGEIQFITNIRIRQYGSKTI